MGEVKTEMEQKPLADTPETPVEAVPETDVEPESEEEVQEREGPSSISEVDASGKYRLSRPYRFEGGEELTILDFPLDKLTGQQVRTAQANYEITEGRAVRAPLRDNITFCAYVAAALMNVHPNFVFGLPTLDFCLLSSYVGFFLPTLGY